MSDAPHSPFRRRVFYIPGFDPFPARRYRELYRKEGALQAQVSGHEIALKPAGRDGWEVVATVEGARVEARVTVLGWSDIVQSSMAAGVAGTYAMLVRTAWVYLSSGALRALLRTRKGPVIAALYPVVILLLQAQVAGWVWWVAFRLLGGWIGAGVGAVLGAAILEGFRRIDRRIFAYYLMHDFAFTARDGGATAPGLNARIDAFAAEIAAALDEGFDEVLVIGHSSGAAVAVQALARLKRQGLRPDRLNLLTLGHAVPMQSFLPRAGALRRDLHDVARWGDIFWLDVTAPGDGCSFALIDPVAVSGAGGEGQLWPVVVSAAFTQSLRPETWARLKRRYFRLHFQYLCAFDAPRDYDYFAITAGPRSLAARFAGRASSPGRVVRALSPHRGQM
jgi:hypothetical protein